MTYGGFLSTPFHEVLLRPTLEFPSGQLVGERLPDSRSRTAVGLRLNHSFSKRFVQRFHARFYDDDWGLAATTLEIEPRFRLPTTSDNWVYPILRFHTQDAVDYFGLPGTFGPEDEYFTADRDMSDFSSEKYGFGWRRNIALAGERYSKRFRFFEARVTSYSRDDGLDSLSGSLGVGLKFK